MSEDDYEDDFQRAIEHADEALREAIVTAPREEMRRQLLESYSRLKYIEYAPGHVWSRDSDEFDSFEQRLRALEDDDLPGGYIDETLQQDDA